MGKDKQNRKPKAQREQSQSPAFVEQYKLYVQSADNTSGRRVSVNRYQTSLNVGLIALYGITTTIGLDPILQIIIAAAGIIISLNWLLTIRSLTRLNAEKFKIIIDMEKSLPKPVYTEEWKALEQEKSWKYKGASFFEKWIPIVFLGSHCTVAIIVAIYQLYQWIT